MHLVKKYFAALLLCSYAALRANNKTQLKLHIGMRYKGVTQRCCPLLLLRSDGNELRIEN